MELTNRELRNKSRADIEGKWQLAAVISFVAILLVGGESLLNTYLVTDTISGLIVSLVYAFVVIIISYGLYVVYYNMIRYGTQPDVNDLFVGFSSRRVFGTAFLMHIFILLWTLLLIVPGIIKGLSYAMTPYIVSDDPTCYGTAAIRRSEQMMRGHKMRYFKLLLSFIGWICLGFITLGIGLIWLIPYIKTSTANFYINLRDSQN